MNKKTNKKTTTSKSKTTTNKKKTSIEQISIPQQIEIHPWELTPEDVTNKYVERYGRKYSLRGVLIPKDGRFTKDYQPADLTKWTEEKALELGYDLIRWLKTDGNYYFKTFLAVERGMTSSNINELGKKYFRFQQLIDVATEIQESKLVEGGLTSKNNAAVTNFVLANRHGFKSRQETEIKDSSKITVQVDNKEDKDIIENILNQE